MIIENINQITKESLKGKVIAFPTDTVYGVGALIDDLDAIEKIYEIKKRDYSKPLAILASSVLDIMPYIKLTNQDILKIMEKYWPGALTIIFKKSENVKDGLNPGFDTIAFRIPNSTHALELLKKTGPLATTSVNISGSLPLNDYNEIEEAFGDKIDYLLKKEVKSSNISSTIIDATVVPFKVVREGEIKIN